MVIEADDRKTMELALIENLQREDLNPMEEAEGYRSLIESFSLTQEEAAERRRLVEEQAQRKKEEQERIRQEKLAEKD